MVSPDPSDPSSSQPKLPMNSSVPLVTDAMEFKDTFKEHLDSSAALGHVIGVVGLQGSGKSTLLSMLAANNPHDKFRQYVFRSSTRDAVDAGYFQTEGISAFVNDFRDIYLDSRPVNSGAVLEEYTKRTKTEKKSQMKDFVADDMTLLATLIDLCHTVILAVDWFIDVNLVRELLRASLYAEFNLRKVAGYPKMTNLVVVHQRANSLDFDPNQVAQHARILRNMFKGTRFDVTGGVSMAKLGFPIYNDSEPDVNYVLLDEMPLWNRDCHAEVDGRRIAYGKVVQPLRRALRGLRRARLRALGAERRMRVGHAGGVVFGPAPTLQRPAGGGTPQPAAKPDAFADANRELAPEDLAFQPEPLPNVSGRAPPAPRPPAWTDLDALVALEPPASWDNAANLVQMLRLAAPRPQEADFVAGLLPAKPAEMTEADWLDYAERVFHQHRAAFNERYFLANTGSLVPKLIRKLKSATKHVYVKEAQPARRDRATPTRPRGVAKARAAPAARADRAQANGHSRAPPPPPPPADEEDDLEPEWEWSSAASAPSDDSSTEPDSPDSEQPEPAARNRVRRRRAASDSS